MSNTEIIWESKLDEKWNCVVTRVSQYEGRLTVSDRQETILSETVPLAYGAVFGPDVGDVASWQDKCVDVVDKYQTLTRIRQEEVPARSHKPITAVRLGYPQPT